MSKSIKYLTLMRSKIPEAFFMLKGKKCIFLFISVLLFINTVTFAQDSSIDSLKSRLVYQKGTLKVSTLNELSLAFRSHDIDTSFYYAIQALSLAIVLEDIEGQINSFYELGEVSSEKQKDELALEYFQKGLTKAVEVDDLYLTTEGYLEIAHFYHKANKLRQSIDYLNMSLDISERNDLKKQSAEAYFLLGLDYQNLSLYDKSLQYYFKSLAINEQINDVEAIAKNFNSIGKVYQHTGDFDDALIYFFKALGINTKRQDVEEKMRNNLNIGVIYQKKGNFDDALAYYKEALPIAQAKRCKEEEAIIIGNIGSTMVHQGLLEEGLIYLQKALAIKEENGHQRRILHTLNDIAQVKILLNDLIGAKEISERIILLAKKYEDGNQLGFAYRNLYTSYKEMQDFEQAFVYLEKYLGVKDSLFGIDKAQQINELQIEYETEKKDQAIASFKQEMEIESFRKKIYFLTGLIILMVVSGLYFGQRQKSKRNKVLLEKEKEVDRLKSNFFANISHEFRTPLTLILGPIETMLSNSNDPRQWHQLGIMKKSASRLLNLINQILDLSKLESGYLELNAKVSDIIPIIKGVTSSFQSLADSKDITLTFESNETTLLAYVDQEHIETISINLISNAFKFSDKCGHITVKVDKVNALNTKDESGDVEIIVIDEGVGIPPEQINHIFDRFYQAGHAKESQYGGTGIGLALTKELVELHRGTINVASERGRGTHVTVKIPLEAHHLQKGQISTNKIKDEDNLLEKMGLRLEEHEIFPENNSEPDKQKPIILLIEDNHDVRNYIKSILSSSYTLIEAVDGEVGIEKATEHIPDLIISDVMMPKIDGYEACRYLKQDVKTAHIPIILLTAKASVSSRIRGHETEADLYLNKPFVPKELLLCIHNLIQSREKLRKRYNKQVVLKPKEIAINSVDELFLDRLMKVVEANYENEAFSVDQLGKEIGMSRSQLHRKLHALTNESSSQFIRSFRLQRALDLLKKNNASVSEVAYKVGFSSPNYFSTCFTEFYGFAPSEKKAILNT